jgi:hypothetical protein
MAADMFDSNTVLDLGNGRSVERREGRAAEDWDSDEYQYRLPRVAKETFCYVFKLAGEHTAQVGEARKTPQPAPTRNEHRTIDALDDFRKILMAALADAGSPAPCTVPTAQIAGLFENCSAHAAGKWMAKLAARYRLNLRSPIPSKHEAGGSLADVCKRQLRGKRRGHSVKEKRIPVDSKRQRVGLGKGTSGSK